MQKLTLTRATEEDCHFLYDLRNEEDVRKNSFQTETFSYESHVAWYKEKLGDKQTQIYILKLDGENIGQARICTEWMEKFLMRSAKRQEDMDMLNGC